MKRKLQQTLIGIAVLFGFMTPLLLVSPAYAASKDDVCTGLADAAGAQCGAAGGANSTINNTITTAINIFSFIIGVAAVIMIMVGGFRYVISQGEGANTAGAKNTILYAVIGLVVVLIAQVIVRFVLSKAT